ncbi:MAG: hypothetical protein JXR25_17540 [Pontiellaceae bacterium]|nr:hypothetical protein [Pontiellaceae bacterium]MBN2786624.1 hypothetical protein [Pontiellaceae bacterium]
MNTKKGPFNPNVLLWWVAIIALVVSGVMYFMLDKQAALDVHIAKMRMIFPLVGIITAGVCLIAGTAGRWFYPK